MSEVFSTPEECGGFKLCTPTPPVECMPCRQTLEYKQLPVELSNQTGITWKFTIPYGANYDNWIWEGEGFNDQYENRRIFRQPQDVNIPLGVTNTQYPDPVNYRFGGNEIVDENLPLLIDGTYAEVYGHDTEPNLWTGDVLHYKAARQMAITRFTMYCSTAGTTNEQGEFEWFETIQLRINFVIFYWSSGRVYNQDPDTDPIGPIPPPVAGNGWSKYRDLNSWTYPDLQYSCSFYQCGTFLQYGEYLGCGEYPLETNPNWVDPTSGDWSNLIDPFPIDLSKAF